MTDDTDATARFNNLVSDHAISFHRVREDPPDRLLLLLLGRNTEDDDYEAYHAGNEVDDLVDAIPNVKENEDVDFVVRPNGKYYVLVKEYAGNIAGLGKWLEGKGWGENTMRWFVCGRLVEVALRDDAEGWDGIWDDLEQGGEDEAEEAEFVPLLNLMQDFEASGKTIKAFAEGAKREYDRTPKAIASKISSERNKEWRHQWAEAINSRYAEGAGTTRSKRPLLLAGLE
ncbi:hypothetical protein HK097_007159 [Rhizophlyctis rosea]|uniref:Uncharacterized protein n=1 Tax=Rhizophlyctis rosea TaxID=64517 RepID=A0AAD5X5D8_9FUNG|nr:hypothetical protein HK097_007159 [Rhizophlyctis rosea]